MYIKHRSFPLENEIDGLIQDIEGTTQLITTRTVSSSMTMEEVIKRAKEDYITYEAASFRPILLEKREEFEQKFPIEYALFVRKGSLDFKHGTVNEKAFYRTHLLRIRQEFEEKQFELEKIRKYPKKEFRSKTLTTKDLPIQDLLIQEFPIQDLPIQEFPVKECPIQELSTKEPMKGSTKRKKSIPSTVKKLVWNKHIGETIGKSKCLCCQSTDITQMSFHCGHIVAESNGGQTIVSNLKPICQNCNSSMGTKNMKDFMDSLQ